MSERDLGNGPNLESSKLVLLFGFKSYTDRSEPKKLIANSIANGQGAFDFPCEIEVTVTAST